MLGTNLLEAYDELTTNGLAAPFNSVLLER